MVAHDHNTTSYCLIEKCKYETDFPMPEGNIQEATRMHERAIIFILFFDNHPHLTSVSQHVTSDNIQLTNLPPVSTA